MNVPKYVDFGVSTTTGNIPYFYGGRMIEYKVERLDPSQLEEKANDLAENGWKLHPAGLLYVNNKVVAVFERNLAPESHIPVPVIVASVDGSGAKRGPGRPKGSKSA